MISFYLFMQKKFLAKGKKKSKDNCLRKKKFREEIVSSKNDFKILIFFSCFIIINNISTTDIF